MSWTLLLALGGASYALKAVGPVLAGGRELGPRVRRTLDLVAVPLLVGLARLYLGAHHLSDVITSLVFMSVWLAFG